MFGFNEKEMQEAEKLADLYDRLRKYARDSKVKVIVATSGVQAAVDVTDMTVTWHPGEPRVVDYLNIIRTKERPVSEKMHELSWDFTMPIGYSALRDGVSQELDGTVEPEETLDDLITSLEDMSLDPSGGHMAQHIARRIGVSTPSSRSDILDDSVKYTYPHVAFDIEADVHREDIRLLLAEYPVGKLDLPEILAKAAEKFGIDPGVLESVMRAESAEAYRDPIIIGGRSPGQAEALRRLAHDHEFRRIPGFDADHDGQAHLTKRYISKRHYWGEGADTPESGARKRKQSDVHVNGKPKKGWQK